MNIRCPAIAIPLLLVLGGCQYGTTNLDIQVVGRPGEAALPPRGETCEFRLDEQIDQGIPDGCREIADAWFGSTGRSTSCSRQRITYEARLKGCALGAEMGQVVYEKGPDPGSEAFCTQMRVRYLVCPKPTQGAPK